LSSGLRAASTRRARRGLSTFWPRGASLRRGRGHSAICAALGAARAAVGISKIDFLGDRRALRRAFCSRGRRAGPAKATRERYDAAMHVTTLNPAAAKMLGSKWVYAASTNRARKPPRAVPEDSWSAPPQAYSIPRAPLSTKLKPKSIACERAAPVCPHT
jgi:hypothetical protein